MRDRSVQQLAIAIDPTSRGFGFAVLEGPRRLVDWGTKYAAKENRNTRCVSVVGSLMRAYAPDMLVLEAASPDGPWWISQYRGTDSLPLRVELRQPPAP